MIAHWPEVFKDVEVKAIPIEYLESVNVTFDDGTTWIIDVNDPEHSSIEDVNDVIAELFSEYEDSIAKVDFRVDVIKIKKDITNRTKRFMKKRK